MTDEDDPCVLGKGVDDSRKIVEVQIRRRLLFDVRKSARDKLFCAHSQALLQFSSQFIFTQHQSHQRQTIFGFFEVD